MERVLHSWPCYELHSSVASSKKSEMQRRSSRLYSQTPLPFLRAMAGCIAIGSRAAAEPLVSFFSTARTNGHAVSLRNYEKASVEEEKHFFPIQASLTQYSFHMSGNRGYDSNDILSHVTIVFLKALKKSSYVLEINENQVMR